MKHIFATFTRSFIRAIRVDKQKLTLHRFVGFVGFVFSPQKFGVSPCVRTVQVGFLPLHGITYDLIKNSARIFVFLKNSTSTLFPITPSFSRNTATS